MYYFNDVQERGRPGWASGALGAMAIALGGCVAPIEETRLLGPPRPTPDARSEVTVERRTGPDGAVECRDVAATAPMVRDVDVRRSFADGAQDRNGALAMLLGAGAGVLEYSEGQVQCSQGGACSAPGTASAVMIGLAAIPLGFLIYNAVAARDSRTVERVAPEVKASPWSPCSK